jgi:Sulfotransferase domain
MKGAEPMADRSLLTRVLRKLNRHRTAELYFVGYPKTGNTWMVYMLGRYVQLLCDLTELPLFDTTDYLGRCERLCVGPTMQFTHRPLLWHDQRAIDLNYGKVIRPFKEKRVVLLIRHPLDTLVSLWMYRQHRRVWNYTGELGTFLEDPVWGVEKYFRFYSLWYEHRDRVKDVLLLRYEDMRSDPHATFARLLQFLAIPQQERQLHQAVADADFENMKKVEQSGEAPRFRSSGYSIFGAADRNNPDAFHVRRGKVGGFRDYLEDKDADRLLDLINRRLPDFFGYSVDSRR